MNVPTEPPEPTPLYKDDELTVENIKDPRVTKRVRFVGIFGKGKRERIVVRWPLAGNFEVNPSNGNLGEPQPLWRIVPHDLARIIATRSV